jgi:hypothetical protein
VRWVVELTYQNRAAPTFLLSWAFVGAAAASMQPKRDARGIGRAAGRRRPEPTCAASSGGEAPSKLDGASRTGRIIVLSVHAPRSAAAKSR